MDIPNVGQQRLPVNRSTSGSSPLSAASRVENVRSVAERDGDRDNSVAQDSTTFSQLSLNLSKTASVSGIANETQIPDGREALQAANNAKAALQNTPASGLRAYSSVSANMVQGLLA